MYLCKIALVSFSSKSDSSIVERFESVEQLEKSIKRHPVGNSASRANDWFGAVDLFLGSDFKSTLFCNDLADV